ncbi:MAG: WYL domain-containing protein [Clostridiales bacterium]|nr:WYL domain-containing protein [Clostridiales bacterium]
MYLAELLNRETDDEHPVTIMEIIGRMNAEGFTATRKTITKDIDILWAHGVDVVRNKSRQNQYFVGERLFELPELILLVDAVQAARFISLKRSQNLIGKLATLASVHQADRLNRQLYVDKQVKPINETVLYTVDLLHVAIQRKTQITFQYFEYTATRKKVLKHGGRIYQFSPYALLWNNDSYYALGYSESHGKVVKFRVDRMAPPKLTELPAVPKPQHFRVEEYAQSVFSMYDEETRTVTLKCENSLMKSIVDRFGTKAKTTVVDGEYFTAEADVSVSSTFFGWVVGFGGRMEIAAPEDVKSKYFDLLRSIVEDTVITTRGLSITPDKP